MPIDILAGTDRVRIERERRIHQKYGRMVDKTIKGISKNQEKVLSVFVIAVTFYAKIFYENISSCCGSW